LHEVGSELFSDRVLGPTGADVHPGYQKYRTSQLKEVNQNQLADLIIRNGCCLASIIPTDSPSASLKH